MKLPDYKIIGIDFDGTIVEEAYPLIGELRPGAKEYITMLYNDGYGIIINTCRAGIQQADAMKFLKENSIPYHYINTNFPHLIQYYGIDCRKISADVYIDDKCLFDLPDWETIYKMIKKKIG